MNGLAMDIAAQIDSRELLPLGGSALVAVSGGVDSMVLLHVLHGLAPSRQWRLGVAHLNHSLRGRSSDADQALVANAAAKLNLPFFAETIDPRPLAKAGRLSLEMAARKIRHEFLARAARAFGARRIVLAHHADDQLELFFLRLFRGSGSEGLAGMKWTGPSPADPQLRLVRPLLQATKAALKAHAKQYSIAYREDASNRCLDIQRNRVRRELLPLLRRRYQPALHRTVLRTLEVLDAEGACVADLARDWIESKHRIPFDRLPPAVQRRALRLELVRRGVVPDFETIEHFRAQPGVPREVAPGLRLARRRGGFLQTRSPVTVKDPAGPLTVMLEGSSGVFRFGEVSFRWAVKHRRGQRGISWTQGREWFDADGVGKVIRLRNWRAGDRFHPSGSARASKLQDQFTNLKIPRVMRHRLVVAETATGEIFWVEGLRISERFKLLPSTGRRLLWQWDRAPGSAV